MPTAPRTLAEWLQFGLTVILCVVIGAIVGFAIDAAMFDGRTWLYCGVTIGLTVGLIVGVWKRR